MEYAFVSEVIHIRGPVILVNCSHKQRLLDFFQMCILKLRIAIKTVNGVYCVSVCWPTETVVPLLVHSNAILAVSSLFTAVCDWVCCL